MRKRNNNENEDNGFAAWGGYMDAKKSKLLDQYQQQTELEPNKKLSNIFEHVSIFVNGYTNPSAEELKRLMTLHGGTYHHYESVKTTHIIASILPNVKIKQITSQKIVKPNWITDSITAGKLLDYKPYLLYTNQSESQPKITSVMKNADSQTATTEARIKTAVDPNFLTEFYNNSRLHLISTLGAMFKKKINDLRQNNSKKKFLARQKIKDFIAKDGTKDSDNILVIEPTIMHVDMDCFFVSVGLLKRPELKGVPVAVTHGKANQTGPERPERMIELEMYKERLQKKLNTVSDFNTKIEGIDTTNSMSEIASCSYEARKLGVKNGMFLGTALKLCPNLETIPYDFDEYTRIANLLYNTITQYTLDVEPVSCDEMYVDITNLLKDTGATVPQWATFIRNEVKTQTNCPCSTGFGSNRLQARLATRSAKPDGQYYLLPENVETYMQNIEITSLPGVGRSLEIRLKNLNLKTCHDLQQMSLGRLREEFGDRAGQILYDHCRGIDKKPLNYDHVRKSVSAEVNYGIRFQNNEEAEIFFKQLCGEVHTRLNDIQMKGKCITLKLMIRAKDAPVESSKFMGHGLCDHITKSSTLVNATNDLNMITREILSIWRKLKVLASDLRGIGIQLSRLENLQSTSSLGVNRLKKFFDQQNVALAEKKKENILKENVNTATVKTQNILETFSISTSNNEKKRGRKKKEMRGQKTIDLFGKLQSKSNQKTETLKKSTQSTADDPVKIDLEFLKSLPEDIRLEIMQEYNIKNSKANEKQNIPSCLFTNVEVNENINQNEIDLSVLNELPEEIRNEIIKEYSLTKNERKTTIEDIVDVNSLKNTLEQTDRNNIDFKFLLNYSKDPTTVVDTNTILNEHSKNQVETKKDFSSQLRALSWNDLKKLIKSWIEEENYPKDADVRIFVEFIRQTTNDRKIEFLYTFIKYFRSSITIFNNRCTWHQVYYIIIENIQEIMIKIYKAKLSCDKNVICNKCVISDINKL